MDRGSGNLKVLNQEQGKDWILYQGDCVEVLKGIPTNSIHYSTFSPPFASLYTYSNSERDMGNCMSDKEFYKNMEFLAPELYRVIMPGRLVSFHCMDIPAMKERDGFIGLKDFPGNLLRIFEKAGFIYHSKVMIWKDPLTEATRTKALGLMHKQIVKDSAMCRQGLPDYLITMRKPGNNQEPVAHPEGFTDYIGTDKINAPKVERPRPDKKAYEKHESYVGGPVFSHQVWRKYASSVWMDINQSNTLNKEPARDSADERHICPLQLDVIERALELWTNPGDIVLSPFAGIGSEGYMSVKKGRKSIGIELKESYFKQGVNNMREVEKSKLQISLFD